MFSQSRSLVLICLGWVLCLQAVSAADSPFGDAIAVWHLQSATDSAGTDSSLQIRGDAKLSVPLMGADRINSLERGGDGHAAMLQGGFLDAGQGASRELQLDGDQFTWLIRLKITGRDQWTTRGFFTKGGGHDQLVFNFFNYDFGQGPELTRVGFELGIDGKPGLGGQVAAHLDRVGFTVWHDLVARYDGKTLALFIDGVNLDSKPVQGKLRMGNKEPVALGAGTSNGQCDDCFPGLIDHAAIWKRALSDAEIITLSGGEQAVAKKRVQYANYTPPQPAPGTWDLVNRSRELKSKFQQDHHRPRYHFLVPEEGEIMPGDPNGAIWWKGRYHLFYIFQRFQSVEPTTVHCWGHASSVDLVHWEHHPTALDVAPQDVDRGIFSGNAYVSKAGVPTILYHGVSAGNSIAEAQDDRLIHWKKSPANPIVPIPKPGSPDHGKYESWDPHGWLEGDNYYAIFGGAKPALFKGPDMTALKHVGPFLQGDIWSEPVEDVSCPDFFPIGDKHMLLCISHCRGARYFLGTWKNDQFMAESHGRMNWPGGGFFAPETLLDQQGRRILWAWCMDERPANIRAASGWSGVMSLPRILSLDESGVRVEPAPELERLRWNPREFTDIEVADTRSVPLDTVQGDTLELNLTVDLQSAKKFGVKLRKTPDGAEETVIWVDRETGQLSIDLNKSTLDSRIRYRTWCITRPTDPDDASRKVYVQTAPLPLKPGEPVQLRIFLDRSMLEVFANGHQCVTQRLWPTRPDATRVTLVCDGGSCKVQSLRAWDMAASQPD